MLKRSLLVAVAVCGLFMSAPSANAQDPSFGYLYGYGLGQANQFRNRLPTPPYFAIYPPVYYGARYERPYGESPFAAPPMLQANPNYQPKPKASVSHEVINPYCSKDPNVVLPAERPVAAVPQPVTIFNPYVTNELKDSSEPKVAAR